MVVLARTISVWSAEANRMAGTIRGGSLKKQLLVGEAAISLKRK
jgi:hypothetical protein